MNRDLMGISVLEITKEDIQAADQKVAESAHGLKETVGETYEQKKQGIYFNDECHRSIP